MGEDALSHLFGQVQSSSVLFQKLYCPDALNAVPEAFGTDPVQDAFPRVTKGSVSQVMTQGNGFRQVFVQAQGL